MNKLIVSLGVNSKASFFYYKKYIKIKRSQQTAKDSNAAAFKKIKNYLIKL